MKKALAALGATLLGVSGAAVGGAASAQAATTLPDCTTANQVTFDFDDTADNFYGTCTPQYGLGKAEFTISDAAGIPADAAELTDPTVTATPSTDAAAVDSYFESTSTNGFTTLTESDSTPTTQTYSGSLAYKLAGVQSIPVTSLPAGCTPTPGITYDHAFEVSYVPTTVTFTQTVDGTPSTYTVTSAPAPLYLGYQNQTDETTNGQLCASTGTDTLEADQSDFPTFIAAIFGVYDGNNGITNGSTLTPFPNESLTGDLGTFFAAPSAPVLTAATPGVGSATVTFTPAPATGATISGYEYSLDGGGTWNSLASTTTGTTVTGTITGLPGATTYPVTVRAVSPSGDSPASNSLSVTPSDPAPTASALSPDHGPAAGGTTVTITGTGFIAGSTSVILGNTALPASAVTVVSSTTVQFVTPAHAAGAVPIAVTTPGGGSATLLYTFDPAVVATAAGSTPAELASTGSDSTPELVAAALALLAGTGLVVASRRRRRL